MTQHDNHDITHSRQRGVFKDDAVWVDGIEYLDVIVGGLIYNKYKQIYMCVKLGRVPNVWVECFVN